MSKIKNDLMKEIEAKVAKKKQLSKQVSRQKTVANWVAEFFTEYDKTRKLDSNNGYGFGYFTSLALNRLAIQLRSIDRKCTVDFKEPPNETPVVEIHWSSRFIQTNNCEEVLAFDASSAFFQSAIEDV